MSPSKHEQSSTSSCGPPNVPVQPECSPDPHPAARTPIAPPEYPLDKVDWQDREVAFAVATRPSMAFKKAAALSGLTGTQRANRESRRGWKGVDGRARWRECCE
jgi:hypothetical protein